jgi:hypothetical protein
LIVKKRRNLKIKKASLYPDGEKMDAIFKPFREAPPAIKYFHDNWGTRSGVDRRKKNGVYLGPERRMRTERRSGFDRRRLSFVQRRTVFDLREAYRDL